MPYVNILDYDMSCGVRNLGNTDHPWVAAHLLSECEALANVAIQASLEEAWSEDCAAFYQGSSQRGGNTERLFEELRFLGRVTRSPERKNPNTGNKICIWTWMPSQKKIKAWLRTGAKEKPSVWAEKNATIKNTVTR